MGSVKDLEILRKPTETELGEGIFVFSDRYSVFDWGEMPDHIPNKGAALCVMAAWNFERLEERGINTHYLGVLDNSGNLVKTTDLIEPTNRMAITLSRVIKPTFEDGKYDYGFFKNNRAKINDYVIPIEVTYRNGAPKGSSLFKTIAKLELSGDERLLLKFLSNYGLTEKPLPGELFPETGYDFWSKFEETDRRLGNPPEDPEENEREAYEISGLSKENFEELKEIRGKTVNFASERAKDVGMVDFDGKHEYRFFNQVELADVVITFDENRFMFNGEQVSKEFLRQYHKVHQRKWYNDVEGAKEKAEPIGISDWKILVATQPQYLQRKLVNLVGEMYASGANKYTGLNLFRTRSLEKVMDDLRDYYVEEK